MTSTATDPALATRGWAEAHSEQWDNSEYSGSDAAPQAFRHIADAQRQKRLRRFSRRFAESKWSRYGIRFVSELDDRQRANLADRIGWPAVNRRLTAIGGAR